MPPQIGNIISEEVYDGKLKSNPLHPITEEITACYFLDVVGKEKKLPTGSLLVCFFIQALFLKCYDLIYFT